MLGHGGVFPTSFPPPCRGGGALAQLVAHLLCKQRVAGSSPACSTMPTSVVFSSWPRMAGMTPDVVCFLLSVMGSDIVRLARLAQMARAAAL